PQLTNSLRRHMTRDDLEIGSCLGNLGCLHCCYCDSRSCHDASDVPSSSPFCPPPGDVHTRPCPAWTSTCYLTALPRKSVPPRPEFGAEDLRPHAQTSVVIRTPRKFGRKEPGCLYARLAMSGGTEPGMLESMLPRNN